MLLVIYQMPTGSAIGQEYRVAKRMHLFLACLAPHSCKRKRECITDGRYHALPFGEASGVSRYVHCAGPLSRGDGSPCDPRQDDNYWNGWSPARVG